jgi:carbonic anhydrase
MSAAKQEQQHPPAAETHWGYEGDIGPEFWHTLNPAYAVAQDGKAQSPINIATSSAVPNEELSKPAFHYTAIHFEMENNGHTIELVPLESGNYITLDNTDYAFQQLHFHAPSEHTINGQSAVMEVHLVHKDAKGNLAVVGILIVAGAENEAFKEAFAKLPNSAASTENTAELEEPIDLSALFTADTALYRYDGSLTTPPCTEGVKWSVADNPLELSQEQIDAFTAIYSGNRRPVQNLNGRVVYITQ